MITTSNSTIITITNKIMIKSSLSHHCCSRNHSNEHQSTPLNTIQRNTTSPHITIMINRPHPHHPKSRCLTRLAAWLCLTTLTLPAIAATHDQTPGAKQKEPIVIQGGTIHTVSGANIENGSILLRDGKIVEVGTYVAIPQDAKIIDAKGKHVYPGLIEANSQLGLIEIESVRATIDTTEVGQINPNVKSQVAFNPDSMAIPVARANGVLLAMSVPTGGLMSGTSSLMQMDGWTWEDMTLQKDVALHVTWPRFASGRGGRRGPPGGGAGGSAEASKRLEELAEWIENARLYAESRQQNPDQPRDARLEALIPLADRHIPMIASAEDAQQIQSAVAFAKKNRIKVILHGGAAAEECSDLLVAESVPVIIAGVYRLPRPLKAYDESYTLPSRLSKAGVQYCISGAAQFGAALVRNLPYHAATAAAYGLSPQDALRAITLSPAEILGVADRVGSLEVGKDATLFIADGDILEIPSQVETAFIQGRSVQLTSHHTELYEKYRTKYERLRSNP